MALNIIINKVSVAASFAAGATVATAVASGGTTPYIYSLATGGDKFAINSSTGVVTTIAAMDITNIASFSVTATDSTTGTALTGTSDVTYPPIQAAIRSKFDRTNVIYKITRDIDLGHGILTIPAGCTLDFQGGSFSNGFLNGNQTSVKATNSSILKDVSLMGTWKVEAFFLEWFGAQAGNSSFDNSPIIARVLRILPNGSTLDLGNKSYSIYNGNTGTTEDNFDINLVPRLYNQNNITIRNGEIYTAHAVSPSRVYFPSSLVIDSCKNITLDNLKISSKGESYGDADASLLPDVSLRGAFAARSGGHALLIVRSTDVTVNNSKIEYAGSVGSFYSMSSDNVIANNVFSSPYSLGYAAFAADGWAGSASVVGFPQFGLVLNECYTNKGSSTYGSKGCLVAEDPDVEVIVNGGVYEDAYANGGAPNIGTAFVANACRVTVNGARVNNCSAVALCGQSSNVISNLIVNNVLATNLRTSVHIEKEQSFGGTNAEYNNCKFYITGTQLWSNEPELSISTVVANMRTSTALNLTFNNCSAEGADTFAVNTKACYGLLKVVGGSYSVTNRIIDSLGWGPSGVNVPNQGIHILGATFLINGTTLTESKAGLGTYPIALRNRDNNNIYTRLNIWFDTDTIIKAVNLTPQIIDTIVIEGFNLKDQVAINPILTNCFVQNQSYVLPRGYITYIERTAIAGDNWNIKVVSKDNRVIDSTYSIVVGEKLVPILGTLNVGVQDGKVYTTIAISGANGSLLTTSTDYKIL